MTRRLALLAALLLAVAPLPGLANERPEEAAEAAAERWLALVDAGDYQGSWNAASAAFRQAVTPARWAEAAATARAPLGALRSRQRRSATATLNPPGAPPGEYVVIVYAAVYAHRAEALETITPVREPDGTWRVSGYYVR